MRFGQKSSMGQEHVHRTAQWLRERLGCHPQLAVVLGSGLGALVERITPVRVLDYHAIPGFVPATTEGHAGRFAWGNWNARSVVVLQGRVHLYEGRAPDEIMFPIRVLHALGVRYLVLTNAAGGLNERLVPGDLMLVRDHISLQWINGIPWLSPDSFSVRGFRMIYDPLGNDAARMAGLRRKIPLREGVYVGVLGPNYETRAEYRMLRRIGGDAVGMSTICEAVAAARLGIATIAISVIANVAHPDSPQRLEHHDVLHAVQRASPMLADLLEELLSHSQWIRESPFTAVAG